MTPKARYSWPFLLILFMTDCTTKELVVNRLPEVARLHPGAESFVRLRLAHNAGTAFGFDLQQYIGSWARPTLVLGMVIVLAVLFRIYSAAAPRTRLAAAGLGLACGGAIGNIVDRLRFSAGVVDFIDVGIGAHRFWTFNVADAGITVGATLLALALWRKDTVESRARSVA